MHRATASVLLLFASGPAFAQAQPPTPAAPAAGPPPLVNRVNEVLPSWLRLRGELRARTEGFDGGGFEPDRRDLYHLGRLRLDAVVTPARLLSFRVQAQDARVARKTVGGVGAPFKAPFDLRLASVDVGGAASPLVLRVGRQELAYGDQRLVGPVSWLNAARTFDAAKVIVRTPAVQVEAFGASVVRILDGAFDKSGNGNRFAGAYATTPRLIPGGTVEPYVFWRRDRHLLSEGGTPGDLGVTTVGARLVGRLPARFDYGVELAVQRGSLGADAVEAWAGHWQLRRPVTERGAVYLIGEYNYASGDEDPADGVRGTFDQLYPTPHDKYGLADQVGWKNVHHARGGLELTPVRGLPMTASYHSWWLAEPHDALYSAGSAPVARIAAGAASRHVGQELDVQVARALTPQLQIAAGYAHILPGGFLKEATPGASYSHPYVMATYVFLAER